MQQQRKPRISRGLKANRAKAQRTYTDEAPKAAILEARRKWR